MILELLFQRFRRFDDTQTVTCGRDTDVLQCFVVEIGKELPADVMVGEKVPVSTKADLVKPCFDVVGHLRLRRAVTLVTVY